MEDTIWRLRDLQIPKPYYISSSWIEIYASAFDEGKKEGNFLKEEKRKIEEEERKLVAAIEETEKQNADVNCFNELEDQYWQEFNSYQFQLIAHQVTKEQFHCDDCGMCRVGGRDNFFHCQTCGAC